MDNNNSLPDADSKAIIGDNEQEQSPKLPEREYKNKMRCMKIDQKRINDFELKFSKMFI